MNKLEFPGSSERLAPDGLYLARGAGETSPCRPYLIGDVFDGVAIPTALEAKRRGGWPSCSIHAPCARTGST